MRGAFPNLNTAPAWRKSGRISLTERSTILIKYYNDKKRPIVHYPDQFFKKLINNGICLFYTFYKLLKYNYLNNINYRASSVASSVVLSSRK